MPPILARAAVVAVVVGFGTATVDAATLSGSGLVIFGDSLSDVGNAHKITGGSQPPSPPYFDRRFSNGLIWADHAADAYRAEGRSTANYAVGGFTGFGGIALQIGVYQLDNPPLGPSPSAVVFAGSNDVLGIIDRQPSGRFGQLAADAAARLAARSLGETIRLLRNSGVQDIVVPNVPDLGLIPRYLLRNPGRAAAATHATEVYNASLSRILSVLRADGMNVIEVDLFSEFRSLVSNAADFGISDPLTPCLVGLINTCTPEEEATRLFWDDLHPTALGHSLLADLILDELRTTAMATTPVAAAQIAPVPVPMPAALLLVALAGLAVVRGRRRPV